MMYMKQIYLVWYRNVILVRKESNYEKKLFVLFVMSLLVVAASAQKFSWPPKSFPMKVPLPYRKR